MISIVDELLAKLAKDPRLTGRNGPRQDLGLLLYAERESINALWKAADLATRRGGSEDFDELRRAVERLRNIFGERA
jgi:hypothetical protein